MRTLSSRVSTRGIYVLFHEGKSGGRWKKHDISTVGRCWEASVSRDFCLTVVIVLAPRYLRVLTEPPHPNSSARRNLEYEQTLAM